MVSTRMALSEVRHCRLRFESVDGGRMRSRIGWEALERVEGE